MSEGVDGEMLSREASTSPTDTPGRDMTARHPTRGARGRGEGVRPGVAMTHVVRAEMVAMFRTRSGAMWGRGGGVTRVSTSRCHED